MYNLLNKTTDIPARKISWNKKYKFEEDCRGKYFLTHLKSPKTGRKYRSMVPKQN